MGKVKPGMATCGDNLNGSTQHFNWRAKTVCFQ